MFCRRPSVLVFLLMILGFKTWKRERMSEQDLAQYQAKRRLFRRKIREAFAVWDDEGNEEGV